MTHDLCCRPWSPCEESSLIFVEIDLLIHLVALSFIIAPTFGFRVDACAIFRSCSPQAFVLLPHEENCFSCSCNGSPPAQETVARLFLGEINWPVMNFRPTHFTPRIVLEDIFFSLGTCPVTNSGFRMGHYK